MSLTIDICAYDGPNCTGGPYMWIQRMPFELRDLGYRVRVRLFTWQDPEGGAAFKVLRANGIEVTAAKFSDTATNVRWLLSQAQGDLPDVFVANHVIPALHAGKFFRKCGIPTIGVLRSDDDFYRAITDAFVCGPKALRLAGLVCVSEYLRTSVLDRNPMRGFLLRRIPSGTPLPATRVAPPCGPLKVAYVGRYIEEQKRATDLVRALCRVVTEMPEVEAVLIGDGPARDSMEEIVRENKAYAVRLLGHLDGEAVQRQLLECHVVVLLSDYEGTPTAVMEAMACGCVPVCLRIRSGIPELVEHEVTGLLVDDRGDGFVSAIRRLRDDPALWAALSRGARARIEGGYSTKWAAAQWAAVIEELAKARRSTRPLHIPRWIALPPVHPDLAHQDQRAPSLWQRGVRIAKRSRFHAGRIKRRLLGLPSGRSNS